MTDLRDSFLTFPDLTPVDHVRSCPKYTNIANRRGEDGVMMEELDPLQMELEQLLAAATQRMRQLKTEINALSDLQDNRKEKKVSRGKDVDHKRSRIVEDRPVKKMKPSDGGRHSPHVPKPPGSHLNSSTASPSGVGRSKAKGSSYSRPVEPETYEEQPTAQRTAEVPNKFWQMVDTYCGPIPQETLALLEKMDKPIPEEYFEVPSLGKHFSQVWAEEELLAEEREGGRGTEVAHNKSSVEKLMKKSMENLTDAEPCPFGSLTQRLISAFVQENIIAPPDAGSGSEEKSTTFGNTNDQNASSKSGKAASSPHTTKLEARIRAELIEQGILEPSESDKEEDEVLAELKHCQQELRAVSTRNRAIVSQLLKLAKNDMKKQELKQKIESANNEVTEHYRKVFAARQKKRNLMKKDKELAMKALKERESLVKQLEQLG